MIHDQIYMGLRRAIMCGHFKPGEQLSARGLATDFDTSQMPVRDALNRLSSEKAVERTNDRRYRIAFLAETYIENLYQARIINEGAATELAATLISDSVLQQLVEIQDKIEGESEIALQLKDDAEAEVDVRNDINLHNKFHFTIYKACENPVLISIIESLWLQYAPGISVYIEAFTATSTKAELKRLNKINNQKHRKIISALRSKNAARAKTTMLLDITSKDKIIEASRIDHGKLLPERHITEYLL